MADAGDLGTEGDEASAPVSDRGRDEDEYKDEDEIKRSNQASSGRTRRAAALAAEALTQPKAARRRRRQDSDVEMDEDEPWFLNCEICHRTGWNEVCPCSVLPDSQRHSPDCRMTDKSCSRALRATFGNSELRLLCLV